MMMRLALPLAVVLLTSATAYAECAWVLWHRTLFVTGPITPTPPPGTSVPRPGGHQRVTLMGTTPLSAYAKREECELAKQGQTGANQPGPTEEALENRLFCLPDTVDPRGPKGGG
jgi:hypothetical protein